jgi:hypothetical protein
MYDRGKPLISIHIPKCAGISFRLVLEKWYGKKLLLHYYDEEKKSMPKKYTLSTGISKKSFIKGICIHGHFNLERDFGITDYYPDVDQFITMLRDPFEVHLSNFFYVKKRGDRAYRDGKIMKIARDNTYDLQRYLSETHSFLMLHFPEKINLQNYIDVIESKFVYIGIVEDFQSSIDNLAKKLGFTPVTVTHENISERTETVSSDLKEEFIRGNPLEWKIYEYVLSRYRD